MTSFEVPGLARPWMLSWRADFGTAGLAEPEQFEMLMQLVLSEGFLSDPDMIATEKVSCVRVPECFLTEEYVELPELKEDLIPPFSLGYLKGYRRSLSLLTILAGIRELGLEAEVPSHVKARQHMLCAKLILVRALAFDCSFRRPSARFTSTSPSRRLMFGPRSWPAEAFDWAGLKKFRLRICFDGRKYISK